MDKVAGIDLFDAVAEAEDAELKRKESEVQRRLKTLLDEIDSLERSVKSTQKQLEQKKGVLEKCRKGDWSAIPESKGMNTIIHVDNCKWDVTEQAAIASRWVAKQ